MTKSELKLNNDAIRPGFLMIFNENAGQPPFS